MNKMNLQKYFPAVFNESEVENSIASRKISVKKLTNLNGKHYFRIMFKKQVVAKSREYVSLNARDAAMSEFMNEISAMN